MNLSTDHLAISAASPIDLQLHTIYSDGQWTPAQLLDHLLNAGFALAAITDHDRVDTVAEIQQLALEKHFPVLVAAEMTTVWHKDMTDVLCYGFDPTRGALGALAQDVLFRQQDNTREVYTNLLRQGYILPPDDQPQAPHSLGVAAILDKPSAQQPHELVALLTRDETENNRPPAGELLMQAGFAWATSPIAAVVEAGHHDGGVCLIAHPGRADFTMYTVDLLDQLRREVPIDGLEVYYPAHTSDQTAFYLQYAQKYDLLTSSGSDSHSADKKPIKYRAELSRRLLERLNIQIV